MTDQTTAASAGHDAPSELSTLPDFIVIGAQKCGTTSLHHYLARHPEVGMPLGAKELDFFVEKRNWPRGPTWYAAQFPSGDRVRGECSPNYSMHPIWPGCAERMHQLIPAARLIYLMRDPINRMESEYTQLCSHGLEQRGIDEALTCFEQPQYNARSQYALQLEQYLLHFPAEQLLVLTAEELRENRLATLRRIFGFLGVDQSFYSEAFNSIRHPSARKRQPRFGLTLQEMRRFSYHFPGILGRLVRHLMTRKLPKQKLSAQAEQKVAEFLAPDQEKLRRMLGREFPEWTRYQQALSGSGCHSPSVGDQA